MKIGLDIDGVLLDYDKTFWEFYKERYGVFVPFEERRHYNFSKYVGISMEEERERLKQFALSSYFDNIQPLGRAVEAIKELSRNNLLSVVTSRSQPMKSKTISSLENFFPGKFNQVFFCSDYRGIKAKKEDICVQENIPRLIEDCAEYALECAQNGVDSVFLFNQPWNEDFAFPNEIKNITRVYGWKDIVERLKR